jgi:hypothetical protein
MVYWEICDDENHVGFTCEFPAGTYYIGNPEEMMLPEFFATACYLSSGAFEDMESDALVFIHTFSTSTFTMNTNGGHDTLLISDSKAVAIMSEDMVKHDRKYEDQRLTFKSPTIIELNTTLETIEMKNSDCITYVSHYDLDSGYDESDEQMYARGYASQGFDY